MNTRAHALLSASSADRWLACPPSAKLNEQYPDESSTFANEGTKAHELAERTLLSGRQAHEMEGDYPIAMRDYVQTYVDYVRSIKGERMTEVRLSFAKWVEDGFGTCDSVVIDDGHLTIVDLKYGKGLRVDALDNAQLKLYALSALDAYVAIWGPIHTVKLAIHQPRLDHVDEVEISAHTLYQWADKVVKPTAELAFKGEGEFKSGDHCQFCKARHTCRARADEALATVGDMHKGPELSNEELAALYPRLSGIVKWANDLEGYTQERAVNGTRFAGLKLVTGRSNRKWVENEQQVVVRFQALGKTPDDYLVKKLIGITAAEELIGKKEFANKFADVVVKPEGAPTLVSITDKRPELSDHKAAIAELVGSV